ncbi:hypothetical protein ScPMuIL_011356 [Solemya velum]
MADLLKHVSEGFAETSNVINNLPDDILAEMCHDIIEFIQFKSGLVKLDQYCKKICAKKLSLEKKQVQSVVNALSYIYRTSAQLKLDQDTLRKELSDTSVFTDSILRVICNVWEEKGKELMGMEVADHLLSVGQLVDMDWKLGIAVSSDSCRNLNAPYVTMTLRVADPSGCMKTHSFEMSVLQFKNFSKQMKEMASLLETA